MAEPTHCSLCTSALTEALILKCNHDLCIPCAAQLVDRKSGSVVCAVCSQMTLLETEAVERLIAIAGIEGNAIHVNAPCMAVANVTSPCTTRLTTAGNGVCKVMAAAGMGSLSPEQRWHSQILPRTENTPPRHRNGTATADCNGGGSVCHVSAGRPVCHANASYPSSPKMMDASNQFNKGPPLANVESYSWDTTKQGYHGICGCHAKLPVAFWCEECNRLMCSECAVMDNKHKNHRVLPVRMAAVHVQANIEGFMSSLRATAEEIRHEKQKLDTAERQINSHVSTSQAKLRQAVFEAQEKLKFFEDNLSKEFDTTGQDACKTIHTLREEVEKRIVRVNREGEQLLLALETLNDVGVLHWYSEAEKTASDLRTFLPDQTSRLIPNVTFSAKPLVISCGGNVVCEFSVLDILRSDTINFQANAYDLSKFSQAAGSGVPDLATNPGQYADSASSSLSVPTQIPYMTAGGASRVHFNPDGSERAEYSPQIGDATTARFGVESTYPSNVIHGGQQPGGFPTGGMGDAASYAPSIAAVPTIFSGALQSGASPTGGLAHGASFASPSASGAVQSAMQLAVARSAGLAHGASYASPSAAGSHQPAVASTAGLGRGTSYVSPSAAGALQSDVSPTAASFASPSAAGAPQFNVSPSAGMAQGTSYASPSPAGTLQPNFSPTFRTALNEDICSATAESSVNRNNEINGDTFQRHQGLSHYGSSVVELPLRPPHRPHELPERAVGTRAVRGVTSALGPSRHPPSSPGTFSAYSPTLPSQHKSPSFIGSALKGATSANFAGSCVSAASPISRAATATGQKGGHSMAPSHRATTDARLRNVALCAGKNGMPSTPYATNSERSVAHSGARF
eukprot:GEMP01006755.1.p1 GENE.GEMP01006755.1~~GEMP01006755.1.p1  ORF type:complete len:856 (-),score=164.68 GEMP01006755.1:811-3378(-)